MEHTKLSRTDASEAVTGLGWRYVLGEFRAEVLTGSLPLAADVAGRAAALPGVEGHLRMDTRVLGAGRPRRQRGLHHHLAGPRLGLGVLLDLGPEGAVGAGGDAAGSE